jgi:hypothetical protein
VAPVRKSQRNRRREPAPRDADVAATRRTYRGGSFLDRRYNCQTPVRRAMLASDKSPTLGFRPVLLLRLSP